MSRTIRRKGWHVTTSTKWKENRNNPFAYIKSYNDYEYDKEMHKRLLSSIDKQIAENMESMSELTSLAKERHRDSFWKTLRWMRYASPIPRVYHKMAIKESLRNDSDYNWDEKAARQYEKGLCQMLWD